MNQFGMALWFQFLIPQGMIYLWQYLMTNVISLNIIWNWTYVSCDL